MANRNSIYRRLSGRKRTLIGYSQLWLGPSHILLVKSARFNEEYQRFAISEIQAIVVTERPEQTVLQIAAAGVAILWTLAALAVGSIFAKGFFVLTGALALAGVITDISLGRRCRCHLHTAVSRELLAPVSRMRRARAFLAQIQPAIEAAQGSLPIERVAGLDVSTAPATPFQPPKVPETRGYLPEILFGLVLLDAIFILVDQRYPTALDLNVLMTVLFAEIVLAIVALFRRGTRDPRRFVYLLAAIVILGAAWDGAGLVRTYIGFIRVVAESAQKGIPPPRVFNWTSSRSMALIAAGWRGVVGLSGLAAAFFARRTEPAK